MHAASLRALGCYTATEWKKKNRVKPAALSLLLRKYVTNSATKTTSAWRALRACGDPALSRSLSRAPPCYQRWHRSSGITQPARRALCFMIYVRERVTPFLLSSFSTTLSEARSCECVSGRRQKKLVALFLIFLRISTDFQIFAFAARSVAPPFSSSFLSRRAEAPLRFLIKHTTNNTSSNPYTHAHNETELTQREWTRRERVAGGGGVGRAAEKPPQKKVTPELGGRRRARRGGGRGWKKKKRKKAQHIRRGLAHPGKKKKKKTHTHTHTQSAIHHAVRGLASDQLQVRLQHDAQRVGILPGIHRRGNIRRRGRRRR